MLNFLTSTNKKQVVIISGCNVSRQQRAITHCYSEVSWVTIKLINGVQLDKCFPRLLLHFISSLVKILYIIFEMSLSVMNFSRYLIIQQPRGHNICKLLTAWHRKVQSSLVGSADIHWSWDRIPQRPPDHVAQAKGGREALERPPWLQHSRHLQYKSNRLLQVRNFTKILFNFR